jgi:hypothetical protein
MSLTCSVRAVLSDPAFSPSPFATWRAWLFGKTITSPRWGAGVAACFETIKFRFCRCSEFSPLC